MTRGLQPQQPDRRGLLPHIFRVRERIGIIGPNGAGWTTLLRVISGEEQPNLLHAPPTFAETAHGGPPSAPLRVLRVSA